MNNYTSPVFMPEGGRDDNIVLHFLHLQCNSEGSTFSCLEVFQGNQSSDLICTFLFTSVRLPLHLRSSFIGHNPQKMRRKVIIWTILDLNGELLAYYCHLIDTRNPVINFAKFTREIDITNVKRQLTDQSDL